MANDLFNAMSSFQDATSDSSYYDDNGDIVQSKTEQLKQRREEKLYKLGKIKQNANLDKDSYTQLPNGLIERNSNKIWNNSNAVDIQTALSNAMNLQVYTRPDGTKYQIDKMGYERDYNGSTQRAYMYGTKETKDSIKFGLANSKLPSSDYRYQPGKAYADGLGFSKDYGWDPGEHGVDLSKKYLDVELPYNVATALEALIHGRMGAIANREYPDMTDPEAKKHSGSSEYYNSLEGMLGDSRGQTASEDHILAKYAKLKEAQDPNFKPKEQEMKDHNILRGVGSALLNVYAKGQSFIGKGYEQLADWQEASMKRREDEDAKHPNKQHGIFEDTLHDWEKSTINWMHERGHNIQKEATQYQLNNDANKATGYNPKNVNELNKDINKTFKEKGFWSAAGKVVSDPRTLEAFATSLPEMAALALSVGGMALVNANNNINLGEAQLGRKMTPEEKANSVAISVVSTYLDRLGDKVAMGTGSVVAKTIEKTISKLPESAQKAIVSKYKNVLDSKYVGTILKGSKIPAKLAGAGAIEGTTEKLQTMGEIAAQDPTIVDKGFTQEQLDQSNVAGVLGLGMGVHIQGAGQVHKGAKKALDYSKEVYDDKIGNLSDESDTAVPESFIGLKNRFESAQDLEFNVTPEAKQAYTQSGVEYATHILTDPSKRTGAYKTRPHQVIKDLTDNIAKIHNVKTEAGKGIIEEEVVSKLYDMTRAKDKKTGESKLKDEDKVSIIDGIKSLFNKNKDTATTNLLNIVRNGEGTSDDKAIAKGYKSGYDVTLGYGKFVDDKSKPLTDMTIKEVLALQKTMKSHKDNKFWTGKRDKSGNKIYYPSSAVGAYQITEPTLKSLIKDMRLNDNTKFTSELQDKMALQLIKKPLANFKSGKITKEALQDKLASVWASIETTKGGSAYGQGVGTNSTNIQSAIESLTNSKSSTSSKYAERALEEEMKTDLIDGMDSIRNRLKNDYSDPLSIATDEEIQNLLNVTETMKTFGSESLTKTANNIEKALTKTYEVLGSGKLGETDKPTKSMKEVSNEVETLGFLYEGRNFKSIKDHARDLDLYVKNGSGETTAQTNKTLKDLEVFTSNRTIDKLTAVTKAKKGEPKLRSIGSILSLNKIKLNETQKLLNMTNDTLESDISEKPKERLEKIQSTLKKAIEDHHEVAELGKTGQYKKLYEKIAGVESRLVRKLISKDPKIVDRDLSIPTKQESLQSYEDELADTVAGKENGLPISQEGTNKISNNIKLSADHLQVKANGSNAVDIEPQKIKQSGSTNVNNGYKVNDISLDYKTPYTHVETFLQTPPTKGKKKSYDRIKETHSEAVELERTISDVDKSINTIEEAKTQIEPQSNKTDEVVQTVLMKLEALKKQRGIVQGKVDRLKNKIEQIDKQRRRIHNAKRTGNKHQEKVAKTVLQEVYNRLVQSVEEALDYIKKYRKAINTRLRNRKKELQAIDDKLRNFYTPKKPVKVNKSKPSQKIEEIKKASEVRIGESEEEEAKNRVKSTFKSYKPVEETYTEEDVAYLDSLEDSEYVSDFGVVEPVKKNSTVAVESKVKNISNTKEVKQPKKSKFTDDLGVEEKAFVEYKTDPKLKEPKNKIPTQPNSAEEKALNRLQEARKRIVEAQKRLDALEVQAESGKRIANRMIESIPLDEAKYQYTLIKNEIKGLYETVNSLKTEKTNIVNQLFDDNVLYQERLNKQAIKQVKQHIKQLMFAKKKIQQRIDRLKNNISVIDKLIKKLDKLPYKDRLPWISKLLRKTLDYVDQGILILSDYKNAIKQRLFKNTDKVKEINQELSKEYNTLEELENRLKLRKSLKDSLYDKLNQTKDEISNTYNKIEELKNESVNTKAKLDNEKSKIETIKNTSKRVNKEIKDKAKEKLDKAIEELVTTRRKIEKALGEWVIPNNNSEIGVSSILSSELNTDEKVDYLMELVPKIIKEAEDGRDRVEHAIKVFDEFSKDRSDNFVNQNPLPKDSVEDIELNPLLQKLFGTNIATILDNNLKSPIKHEVRTAMNVASVLTLGDMISMRETKGDALTKEVKGAFSALLDWDKLLSGLKVTSLKKMIRSGHIVPEATFAMSAGREFINQLEIRLDTKSKIKGQTADDITLALGYLVVNNLLPKNINIPNKVMKRTAVYDEKEGAIIIRDRVKQTGNSKQPSTNVIDLSEVSEKYIKDIIKVENVFKYIGKNDHGIIRIEPKVYKKGKMTKNSKVEIPEGVIEYLNKQNTKAWRFSDSFERFWSNFEGTMEEKVDALKEHILGTLDDVVANSTTMEVESNIAAYRANSLAIERMMMAYNLSKGKDFYLDWNYTVSGRSMMDSKMINPQSNGISRFAVEMNGMVNEVDKNNFSDRDLYQVKAALAQALDLDIDKDTDDNVFKELEEKFVKLTNVDGKLEATFPKNSKLPQLMKSDFHVDAVKKAGLKTSAKGILHIYQAIDFLNMVKDHTVGTFKTNLALEADGITNGMSATLMQMGWTNFTKGHLERTGVYSKDSEYKNHGEFKSKGGNDVYQAPIPDIQEALGEDITEGINSIIGTNWRNFMKNPVMIFIYGANLNNIIESVAMSLVVGNSYIKGGLVDGKFEELKTLVTKGIEELQARYSTLTDKEKKELQLLNRIKAITPTYKKFDLETNRFITLTPNDIGFGDKKYAYITDYQAALLAGGISKVIGGSFKEGFKRTFKDVTEYRRSLKMVEQANYAIFKVAFKAKLEERGIYNGRMGELTAEELLEVLNELKEEGVYYSSKNAVKGEGEQDFFKTGTMDGTEADFLRVKLSSSKFQSYVGEYRTINKIVKDLKANVGSIGVTNIHNVDGTVMVEGHINDVLNVFDAIIMGSNAEENTESVQGLNQAFYDVSMRHSILGNVVEKLARNGSKYMKEVRESGLGEELFQDIKRIFEIPSKENDMFNVEDISNTIMNVLDSTDKARRDLVKEPLFINQYYATDDIKAVKSTVDESTLERHAVFSNDFDLAKNERTIVKQMLETLVTVANEGIPKDDTQFTKVATKPKQGTITKEQIPREVKTLINNIEDKNVKAYFKKWLDKNLEKMENC